MRDITNFKVRVEQFAANLRALKLVQEDTEKKWSEAKQSSQDHGAAIQLCQFMAEKIAAPSEVITAKLATLALRECFPDLNLSLLVEHTNMRGNPAMIPRIKDDDTGACAEPRDAFGGGPAAVLSLIFRVITIIRQPSLAKVLILDEPLLHPSKEYQYLTARLLRKLCEPMDKGGLGFTMLVVTHNPIFQKAAHKSYSVRKSEDGKSLVLSHQPQIEEGD